MDDDAIVERLRIVLGDADAEFDDQILEILKEAPLSLFEELPIHEKQIATAAFVAAASTRQTLNTAPLSLDANSEAFKNPTLGETRTRTGIVAATAALLRIPQKERSSALSELLENCTCNPTPILP